MILRLIYVIGALWGRVIEAYSAGTLDGMQHGHRLRKAAERPYDAPHELPAGWTMQRPDNAVRVSGDGTVSTGQTIKPPATRATWYDPEDGTAP